MGVVALLDRASDQIALNSQGLPERSQMSIYSIISYRRETGVKTNIPARLPTVFLTPLILTNIFKISTLP
jgi:hypothetical protein